MKYIFDPSAIFAAIQLGLESKVIGNCTTVLAKYELGNIILKEGTIHNRLSANEQDKLLVATEHLLGLMQVLDIDSIMVNILDTARKKELPFYDASYVYYSKAFGIPLITEDNRLTNKTRDYIKSFKIIEV